MKHFYLTLSLICSLTLFGQTSFTSSITLDLSAYGEAVSYPGQGEYQIFLSADNQLDKPIFLVDGFDPNDDRNMADLYDTMNYSGGNLADELRADGYDIVALNFPNYTRAADAAEIRGGGDFIDRNAMLLVDLITLINGQKTGIEQNVIIGPSMGGLVARYALNYMEANAPTYNHDTRLYISFDSPHHGANVPIGFQYLFNYMAYGLDANNVVELQPIVDNYLKSAAARQLLTDHLEAHLVTGDPVEFDPALLTPDEHPFRTTFNTNMNALTASGFPETVRNVSIISGSGIRAPYQDNATPPNDVTPGFNVVDDSFDAGSGITAEILVNLTPSKATTAVVSKLRLLLLIGGSNVEILNREVSSQSFDYSHGVDATSGGLFNISTLTAGIGATGLVGDFLAALKIDHFNFIPSVSAMAMEITDGEIDWDHAIDLGTPSSRGVVDNTPFVNWFMPDANEDHVQLTPANVAFAISEIDQSVLGVSGLTLGSDIRLQKNPITDDLVLLSNRTFENAKLTMVDLTGKTILSKTITLEGRTSIPLHLTSGLYVLNIETQANGNLRMKVVVK